MDSSYLTSAQQAQQLPDWDFPEVAFIGRSNCGKSSLLNALLERKNLAISSSTPGRTQMINFFCVKLSKTRELIFADLPGYGFNVAQKKVRHFWDDLMAAYTERRQVRAFIYLVDARRELDDFEFDYMRDLASKKPLLVVLTKTDKISAKELKARMTLTSQLLTGQYIVAHGLYAVSNLKKTGVLALREVIFGLMPEKTKHADPIR